MPESHRPFWSEKRVNGIVRLYKSCSVTPEAVLRILETTTHDLNGDQEHVYSYLKTMIGNMATKELQAFVRFMTGSSSSIEQRMQVQFTCLTGAARRPIAHTCSSLAIGAVG